MGGSETLEKQKDEGLILFLSERPELSFMQPSKAPVPKRRHCLDAKPLLLFATGCQTS